MPRSTKSKKSAAGSGTLRKKEVISTSGKKHTYWEGRVTVGYDPGTGRQIQRSVTGKTQKETLAKMQELTSTVDQGTYIPPSNLTVGEWLDIWQREYLIGVKPRTMDSYQSTIKGHLKPNLGAIKLDSLAPHTIQAFYNSLSRPQKGKEPLSAKTVKNIHGVLHKALQQAVANGYIRNNPTTACVLPRIIKKEIQPMDETQIAAFLQAIKGHRYEALFTTALFTGTREGEILGLQWPQVDLSKGTITIKHQLQKVRGSNGEYTLVPTKNSKSRTITVASSVVAVLKNVKRQQLENKLLHGACWDDSGFVFTDELGRHLKHQTVYLDFKEVVESIGCPNIRFHDLRHSYAVVSIKAGDPIKTVQENLGHATAAFTLDVYGHVTDQMKKESASRMEQFIQSVTA